MTDHLPITRDRLLGLGVAVSAEEHQDFLQFLSGLLASGRVSGELRDFVRATLAEEDRFRQWQDVLEILERGERGGLFRLQGYRDVRGVEHIEFIDLESRAVLSIPRPPVTVQHVLPYWPGKSFRLPVPLPTSEASLLDALRRFLDEEVRHKLGADLGAVYLLKGKAEEGPEFGAVSRGEGFTTPPRFLPSQVDRWVLGRGMCVSVGDLRRDPELDRWSQRGMYRSVVAVALTSQDGGRPVGVLEAWSRQAHFFRKDELGCLVSLAHFLADLSTNALYLKDQIFRDDLTGVFNRRYFDQVLLDTEMLRSRRTGREFGLLMVDIDDFKRVNDRHGHLAGDQVLRQVALILSDRVRPKVDIVSRYGGEEFAILLTELSGMSGARVVAERLRSEIASFDFSLVCAEVAEKITVSVGGALYRGSPETSEQTRLLEKQQLVERADAALYQAKRASKNSCCIWEEAILNGATGDLSLQGG